jgi:hypothetical protein
MNNSEIKQRMANGMEFACQGDDFINPKFTEEYIELRILKDKFENRSGDDVVDKEMEIEIRNLTEKKEASYKRLDAYWAKYDTLIAGYKNKFEKR